MNQNMLRVRPIIGGARDDGPAKARTRLVVIGLVLMVTYVALPNTAADVFFQIVEWVSIGVFVRGIRRNSGFTLAWTCFGIGWFSFSIGDFLFSLYDHVLHIAPFPSPADVFYLAGYPFIAAGLASLVRRSRPSGDRIALIDASIVLVPLTVAAWVYLIEPYAASGSTLLERTVSGAYPLGDLLCLAVLVRLFAGPSMIRRHAEPAMTILGFSLLAMLAADVWFVVTQLHGSYVTGGWNDSLYILPYIGIAGAASHPSIRHVGEQIPRTDPLLGRRRRWLLTVSALITPAILAIEWSTHGNLVVPLIEIGTAVSFLLVIARMATLVEALEHSRQELTYDATHDHLTGLVNRSLFTQRIDAMIAAGTPGSLLFIDLDNFKQVNDRFGHHAGDEVLCLVGNRLCAEVRTSDSVARLAGDEFAVLLAGADEVHAGRLAERLVQQLSVDAGDDGSVPVTASIGIVSWRAPMAMSAQSLLAEADRAMYVAKGAAGNQFASAG
ncbi:MAG TPA: GGDEF domain-containing protein [Ilumatobacteraceae bacterium]